MHRNLSKHASRVKRSVPYYLIFILILSGAVNLLIFSFFPLEKNHFFKQINSLLELVSLQPNARLPGSNKSNPLEAEIDKDLWDSVNKLADLS